MAFDVQASFLPGCAPCAALWETACCVRVARPGALHMKILVLGSGADGGVPQWNCRCPQCTAMRRPGRMPRTQSSVAVSPDGERWILLNVAPDIAQQIRVNLALQPPAQLEASCAAEIDTPIKALVLMDSHWQSVGGLQNLRESTGMDVYATPRVFEDMIDETPLRHVLTNYGSVRWHLLPVAGSELTADFQIPGFEMLRFTAIAVPAATAHPLRADEDAVGQSIALSVQDLDSGLSFVFAPLLPDIAAAELAWLQTADCVMVDGRGEAAVEGLPGRLILTHLGHGSPLLDEHSSACQRLAGQDIELAFDGMVIDL